MPLSPKPPSPPPSRKIAPHVQSAVARSVQRQVSGPAPNRQSAPHVQAAISRAAQPKMAPLTGGRQSPPPLKAAHFKVISPTTAAAAQLKAGTSAVGHSRHQAGSVIQRAAMDLEEGLGFQERKEPSGYGAVRLSASGNGIDLGPAWSTQPKASEGTEHAEDNVIEYVQALILKSAFGMATSVSKFDREVMESIVAKGKLDLVIADLTASPCSSRRGTTKEDMGCAEKLIEMVKTYENFSLSITADHYYQPRGVASAKEKSRLACADMVAAGIKVTITNS